MCLFGFSVVDNVLKVACPHTEWMRDDIERAYTLKSFKNAKKKIGNFLHQGYFKSSVTGERDQ